MHRFKYNRITKEEYLKLNENDVIFNVWKKAVLEMATEKKYELR